MNVHPLAGKSAPPELLIQIDEVLNSYDQSENPHGSPPRIQFGTSGHRGDARQGTFNEIHVRVITQAICDYRRHSGITGPLFLVKDSHLLSGPAFSTALEVLVANQVLVLTPPPEQLVPTPAVTQWIEGRANQLLTYRNIDAVVRRVPHSRANRSACVTEHDFLFPYVHDLPQILDLEVIRSSSLRIGVDPMGGASLGLWQQIAECHRLDIRILNDHLDPRFPFVPLDHDGKIRMDCSSPYAMADVVRAREEYDLDLAFGNDTDADRHGIVTRSEGLMNPNRFLSVALDFLLDSRPEWPTNSAVGKTAVTTSMLDRVAAHHARGIFEVPVGFKWFVGGLQRGDLLFAGEKSAGATFLKRDGTVWTTEKDGIVMALLAAEMMATTGKDASIHYRDLEKKLGAVFGGRVDLPASPDLLRKLQNLTLNPPEKTPLAGILSEQISSKASGNRESLGGLKIVTEDGWIALRPSGTEPLLKLYAESFISADHLKKLQQSALELLQLGDALPGPSESTFTIH